MALLSSSALQRYWRLKLKKIKLGGVALHLCLMQNALEH